MNDGDWICNDPNCGNINFARRAACYRCNKERPDSKNCKKKLGTEIGKSAAEKSRGLFNADDWQCNKCANVNWARRQTCNVCNAPKFGEVEARTGYGGGYNERGTVEYRRREPSSDDEYDEFGRKKRKRKADSLDKVGITEGPAFKKLPPPMQKDKMDRIAASKMQSSQNDRHVSGSLSDGSVCDAPPLSKVAFRRNQLQTQTNYHKQNYMIPAYNGGQSRKRFSSASDRDQFCSSGYETSSKNSLKTPGVKSYNPVMENRVSSTNNDVVYKFTGPTPAESFQVTYTLEERVNAAAFALVYKNCKISTDRFEAMFDKPAPDFKTIFAWRQRLLSTGCLVDSHLELKKDGEKPPLLTPPNVNTTTVQKPIVRLPNPDEIVINSSSEDEDHAGKDSTTNTQVTKPLVARQRSASAETLLIGGDSEQRTGGGSISGRESRVRSRSQSSHQRSRSSSQDSSRSLDSDCIESKPGSQSNSAKLSKQGNQHSAVQSSDSDSDSLSYDSEDNNFLTRVFEKGRKLRRKPKKRPTQKDMCVPESIPTYSTGYTTAKPIQQSPLVTGNIYMSNLRNMNIKSQDNTAMDTDGCSSEYVPVQLGSSTKNYQAFKDNVRRKGFWAKGNAATMGNNRPYMNNRPPPPKSQQPMQQVQPPLPPAQHFPIQQPPLPQLPMQQQQPMSHFPIQPPPMQQLPIHQPHVQQNYVKQMSTQQPYIPPSLNLQPPLHQPPPLHQLPPLLQPPPPLMQKVVKPVENPIDNTNYNSRPQGYVSASQKPTTTRNGEDFTKDDLDNSVTVNHYLPFDKNTAIQAASTPTQVPVEVENPKENTSRVFDAVQSHSTSKNRSILDIFDTSGGNKNSPERSDLENYDSVRKKYESEWDEDDDALYKVDSPEAEIETPCSPSTPNKSTLKNMTSIKPLYESNKEITTDNVALHNLTADVIIDKQEMLMNIIKNFQTPKNEIDLHGSSPQKNIIKNLEHPHASSQNSFFDTPSMMTQEPDEMPCDISDEIISMSGMKTDTPKKKEKKISPSKKVHIIESITIQPTISQSIPGLDPPIHTIPLPQNSPEKNLEISNDHHSTTNQFMTIPQQLFVESDNENQLESISEQLQSPEVTNIDQNLYKSSLQTKSSSQDASAVEDENNAQTFQLQSSIPDLSNLLAGINTNTLLLALQNLTQISQNNSANDSVTVHNVSDQSDNIETINLATADEWEKESHRGSIERELEKMDGNTGDTPFLSDIFDPGPVNIPPNVAKRLNLNTSNAEENDSQRTHLNQNAPVIGNFKSFALPKPIMLNRLKLTVKPPEKKKPGNAKKNRKRKSKPSSSQGDDGDEEQDDEESGDEADLSKYDLWGSDEEQGNSSKAENAEKSKDGESSKEDGAESNDKNGKSPEAKGSKKRSRSSSSSSSTSSSSSSSHSSTQAPKNKFDDFNLNSERESSPKGRKSRSRSRSPRARSGAPARRKSRDSRSAGESRSHESSRDKERSRDRERRDKSRGARDERKERRYSRDGNGFGAKARHR